MRMLVSRLIWKLFLVEIGMMLFVLMSWEMASSCLVMIWFWMMLVLVTIVMIGCLCRDWCSLVSSVVMNLLLGLMVWLVVMQKLIMLILSRVCWIRLLSCLLSRVRGLCRLGVSMRMSCVFGWCTMLWMVCRVVCGWFEVMVIFLLMSAFVSVDLLVFG